MQHAPTQLSTLSRVVTFVNPTQPNPTRPNPTQPNPPQRNPISPHELRGILFRQSAHLRPGCSSSLLLKTVPGPTVPAAAADFTEDTAATGGDGGGRSKGGGFPRREANLNGSTFAESRATRRLAHHGRMWQLNEES